MFIVAVVVGFPQNYLLKQMLRVQYIHKECVCVAQPVFLKVLTGISLNMQYSIHFWNYKYTEKFFWEKKETVVHSAPLAM